jgi:type IV secretion system protein VirD4
MTQKTRAAGRAAVPYVAAYGLVLAAAGVADAAWHVPPMAPLPVAVAAAALAHATIRLHEAHGWHRSGGRAAMRHRRRFQGTASRKDIRASLSPQAAVRKARATCPDLPAWQAPILIGRAKGHDVAGTRADSYLVIAPPQTLKTAVIASWAQDAPGALLATSSRGDLYRHTAIPRARSGEVLVLNADGDPSIPCNLAWSPVGGCEDPEVAIRRAGDLMAAAPRDSSGKDAWHEDRGAQLLRYALHAAAVSGADMRQVAAWVHDPLADDLMRILITHGYPGWAGKLAGLTEGGREGDYISGLISSAAAAIGWMDNPLLAALACPDGPGFDAREFIEDGTGSLYLLGEDRPHSTLAPYFAALTSEVFAAARAAAEACGGRLQFPLTMALDEAATICPVPIDRWSAVAAGYNITLIAGIQAKSQLARWGDAGAATIWNNFTTKVVGGGFTDPGDLEALSAVCGERDTWHHVRNSDRSRTKQPATERLFPPEKLRLLAKWHALVLHRNTKPVEVVVTPVWERRGYEPVTPLSSLGHAEPLAIGPPHGEPIPMPAAAPAPVEAAPPVPQLIPVPDYPHEEAVPSWPATSA